MSAYSNAAAKVSATTDYKITITAGDPCTVKVTPASDAGSTSIENYFKELTNIDTYNISKMESKAGKKITKVEIDVTSAGQITTTTTCSDGYNFDVIEN